MKFAMKQIVLCVVLLTCFFTFTLINLFAQAKPMELFKMVQGKSISSDYYPQSIREHEIVFNESGKKEEETLTRLSMKKSGASFHLSVLSCKHNGKDLGASDLKAVEKEINNSKDEFDTSEIEGIFSGRQIKGLSLQEGQQKEMNGKKCSVIPFKYKGKSITWSGNMYIETESATPLKLIASPSSMPKADEGVKIKSLTLTVYYGKVNSDSYAPVRTVIKTIFIAKVIPLVTFKGNAITETKYSTYAR